MRNLIYKKISYLLLLIISACTGDVSRVETKVDQYLLERNNSLELLDLLQEFTSGNSWDTGENNIHIKWLTNIHIMDNESEEYVNAFLYKKGRLHITLDSTFTDSYNRARAHPVPWSIHMYGGRSMFFDCMIKTDTTGGNPEIIEDYLEKKKVLVNKYYFTVKDDLLRYGRYGMTQYIWCVIKLKDGRKVNILHEALYMNIVCDQALYFNSDGSDKIQFPKKFFENYKDTIKHVTEFN